jgi:hypothetical protein
VLRFNGYLSPFTEQLEENQLITAIFRSPFGRLLGDGSSGTGRYTDASIIAEEKEQSLIAQDLINLYGGIFSGGTESAIFNEVKASGISYAGLALGSLTTTGVARTITYPYANVGQAIINLSECIDGFDWEETWLEESGATPSLAAFNTYTKQGEAKPSALFQYGASTLSNVSSVQRTTGSPINIVRLLGSSGMKAEVTEANSKAKYGDWLYQETASDASSEAVLEARAKALLREGPTKTLSIAPDFAVQNCPLPFDDFYLGDTVSFYGNSGAFQESLEVRINELTIVIDENGYESAAIPDPFSATQESPDALHTVLKVQA